MNKFQALAIAAIWLGAAIGSIFTKDSRVFGLAMMATFAVAFFGGGHE